MSQSIRGADLLIQCLERHGVEYIFGIPGAKVDALYDALLDSNIKLIVCRHEQNAAFIAAAYGRMSAEHCGYGTECHSRKVSSKVSIGSRLGARAARSPPNCL